MNPELENFLEAAFQSVQPTSPEIGRVVVEPDYEVSPAQQDCRALAEELIRAIREHPPNPAALASHEGFEIDVSDRYPLLSKYIRSITLHNERVEG
ncbi:MAG: hypothetical protein WB992_17955, partial [Bryobacteraceae bacterium]